MNLLIATSEPTLAEIIAYHLRELSSIIQVTSTEESFCRICCRYPLDIAVTSFLNPFLNGTDLARQIREQGLKKPLFFLICPQQYEPTILSLYESGIDQYFTLPVNMQRLRNRISAQFPTSL